MKGIILAGGSGTRLYPITRAISKQLIPVYDKPMIYYPLSTLMLAGIRDILIISAPYALSSFEGLLGDGSNLGINISYTCQAAPKGIAESFIIGERFIGKGNVCLILGDNIFYGHNLPDLLKETSRSKDSATIFGYFIKDPQRYGVIEFDGKDKVLSIAEKPQKPKSNYVVTGLYFYDNEVVKLAKSLKPSSRGELEITDINNEYLKKKKLEVKLLGRGCAWLDMGTPDSLIEASTFIKTIEDRQGLKVGCIEEVAYRMGYIDAAGLERLIHSLPASYGEYLKGILKDEPR
ncbi:MAG: glucose-1-phosphate thymidylyltransferase RfbA [Candidatus Omnitrophica bacterium]|nr:glucose-1-phosphate thymidylyltransferase RfbA [Candidatus Omnitrophota bacterium]